MDCRQVLRLVVGDHAGRIGYASAAWFRVGGRWSRCHLHRDSAVYPAVMGVGRRHGLRAILVRTCSIGLVVGLVLAAAFALFSSGEPSASPMTLPLT